MAWLAADTLGWLAAGLTAATFACTEMKRLRVLALLANLAFIGYGSAAGLAPVLVLHLVLAPLNAFRLLQLQSKVQTQMPVRGESSVQRKGAYVGPQSQRPRGRPLARASARPWLAPPPERGAGRRRSGAPL